MVEGAPVGRNSPDEEIVLPFGWWIHERRWMPISYFDPYGNDVDRSGRPSFDPWQPKDVAIAKVCAYCHNTLPYIYRFATDADALGFHVRDLRLDLPSLRGELAKLVPLDAAFSMQSPFALRLPLDKSLVTVGISCESCHFGARAHAEDADDYRFGPASPHLALEPASPSVSAERRKDNPFIVQGICRQCHSSSGDSYPDGSSLINSREAIELEGGACASKISCINCHDPHVAGPREEAGPDRPEQVRACLECHPQHSEPKAAAAHARHTQAQASCLDCHMPRITPGVTSVVRSHRISSPGDPRMLAAAAPNACQFCHADKSLAWLLAELRRGWNRRIEPDADWARTWGDDLERRAVDVWRTSSLQQTRIVLSNALERRSDAESLEQLLSQLDEPAGMTRAYVALALERRVGRPLSLEEIDVTAPSPRRREQIANLRESLRGR